MNAPKIGRMVNRGSAAYLAAAYIFKNGPQMPDDLFAVIDFGPKKSNKQDKLDRAVCSGWLTQGPTWAVDIGDTARLHFEAESGAGAEEEKVEYIGQIAATREPANVFARPPLSKKYIPNPRGLRQDIPEWSVRTGASFNSLAGGE